MPDRILRDELLESQRWLDLPSPVERLAFVCLIPFGDALGNLPADRLWRLWREPLDLTAREQVKPLVVVLVGADLIRTYPQGEREYIHIPRYRQRLRYFGSLNPPSPWQTDKEIQLLAKYSPDLHLTLTCPAPPEVKRSEVKRSEVSKRNVVQNPPREAATEPQGNNAFLKKGKANGHNEGNGGRWDHDDKTTDAKGRELGLAAKPGESYHDYKRRLWAAINANTRGTQ